MASYTLKNELSTVPLNCNVGYNNSWIHVQNNANRELFSQASYITNFDDLSISLSAADLNIGSVHIQDPDSGLQADVVPVGVGLGALRVISQDLEASEDDVTIGDKNGNFASVYAPLSALKVYNTNPISSIEISNVLYVKASSTFPVSGSVTILNPITSVSISNFPTQLTAISINNQLTGITILNPITSVSILNPITSVSISNFPTQLTAISINNQLTGITILNPITSVSISNFPTQLTAISINNQLTGITILNPITSINVLNPISLKDINNNNVSVVSSTSSLNVNVTNPIVATIDSSTGFPITFAASPNFDAFGRMRVSNPLTLFDSSHRYRDNNLWSSLTAVGGTYSFNQNQGLMNLTVNALSGSSVIRETTKAFAYQPGKSLLLLNTFVFAPSSTNLRQRVGYYGADNGIYLQLDGGVISFVERSLINGSPSTESIIPKSDWNIDKLNGTGPSGFTLDITKAQIFWMDVEWLGVGTVRCGFVIDGKFVHCHSFHHANRIDSTYITTASLPLRYEITNKAATAGSATMKQICSSVISEGGYELRGLQQAVGTAITAPKTLTSAGTYYPVVSIRLKASPNRLDAIVIITALSMMPVSTGNFNWRVIANGTTGGGGAWQDAGIDSAIEYKLDGTSITGGRILAEGYLTANSTYGNSSITNILKESLFKFQLERNGLTKTPYEITLALAASTSGDSAHASMDWEEVSR
jgi:hypothetical protein